MCVAVAAEAGPRFPDVLEQPWALTLWTYHQLTERKRIRDLIDSIDAVNKATLNALAFNEPNKLSVERETALDAAKRAPRTDEQDTPADVEWRTRAARMLAALEGGQVLED